MPCNIIKNNSNQPIDVKVDGKSSDFFKKLASFPLIDQDQALEVYKNILSDKFKTFNVDERLTYQSGEPIVYFKSGNDVFPSYKDALKSPNKIVEIGFINGSFTQAGTLDEFNTYTNDVVKYKDNLKVNNPKSFVPLVEIDSSSNLNTVNGFINYSISKGTLSDSKVLIDGVYYLKGEGEFDSSSVYNSQIVRWDAVKNLGVDSVKVFKDGSLELYSNENKLTIATKTGVRNLTLEELDSKISDGNFLNSLVDKVSVVYNHYVRKYNLFDTKEKQLVKVPTDKELKQRLTSLITGLGITTTSMDEYLKSYKDRYNSDVNIEALADIANQIIAISEGKETPDILSEELSHFIIEGFKDQELVREMLNMVEDTVEWNQSSAAYFQKYSQKYSGKKLDDVVRREVLGKALSKRILNQLNEFNNVSFLSKLTTLYNRFKDMVKSYFNPNYKKSLDSILDSISEKLLNNELQDLYSKEILSSSDLTLFSLETKRAIVPLIKARRKLERQLKTLKKAKDTSQVSVEATINKLRKFNTTTLDAINDLDIWQGIVATTTVVDSQVKALTAKANEVKRDGKLTISPVEQGMLNTLNNDYLEVLRGFKEVVLSNSESIPTIEQSKKEVISLQIDGLITDIQNLTGRVEGINSRDFETISKRIQSLYGLTESEQVRLAQLIENDLNDIGWFQSNFGSLEHASNPFLGMLGKIININSTNARMKYLNDIKDFRRSIVNWKESDWKRIIKLKDGKITPYFKSHVDFDKFDKAEEVAKKDAFNKVILAGKEDLSMEDYLRLKKLKRLKKYSEFTEQEAIDYSLEMEKWYEDNTEKRYKKSFYEKRRKLYVDNNISKDTIDFLRNLSAQRAIIIEKYREDGLVDYSKISDRDMLELQLLASSRKSRKNFYDANTGEFKQGNDLIVAEELEFLDQKFLEDRNETEVRDEFKQKLIQVRDAEGEQAAYKWLVANGGVVFNDNFWEEIINSDGLNLVGKLGKLREDIDSVDGEVDLDQIDYLINELKSLISKKKNILKQFLTINNPSEIAYDIMTTPAKENIIDIEERLEALFKNANNLLNKYDFESVVASVDIENTTNNAYDSALKESNMEELDFAKLHMTSTNRERVNSIKKQFEYIVGGSTRLNLTVRRFLDEFLGEDSSDPTEVRNYILSQGVDNLTTLYARKRVLPYFKRFAPTGYKQKVDALENGSESTVDFFERLESGTTDGVESYLEVKPAYSWLKEDEDLINPNYNNNFEGGFRQPKLYKDDNPLYLDTEYLDYFGISDFDPNTLGTPTANLQDYEMLQKVLNYKRTALEAMDSKGLNIYTLPAYSKQKLEKAKQFLSNPLTATTNAINDLAFNRVDDLDYGAMSEGLDIRDYSDIRLVPKYGIRKLEETTDLSLDLGMSVSRFLRDAYSYRERQKTISDVNTLRQAMIDKGSLGNTDVMDSKSLEMFNEFVDFAFYGIKRNKKFELELPNGKRLDVSKLAMAFDRFVRYMNLGFNSPVALTSLTTGLLFKNIEARVGEHINVDSSKWATKEHRKLMGDFLKDIGKVDRDNRLFMLGELFDVFEPKEVADLTSFNRLFRVGKNLPYRVHTMANFPVTPKIMLAILDDFRLVDGEFVTSNQFKEIGREDWDSFRDHSAYNYLQLNDSGVLDFTQELKDELGTDYLNGQMSRIQNKVQSSIANIDSVVPRDEKSAATRHYLMTFATAHRGWLSIALQRRFKPYQFNFATGMYEEGHYRSFAKLLKSLFQNTAEGNVFKVADYLTKHWDLLTPLEKRNMRRVGIESGWYAALLAMGIIVANLADDEDNKDLWALQMSAYIYFRTTNEVASNQILGGVEEIGQVLKTPFMAVTNLQEIADLKGWSMDEVKGGTYKGYSKLYRKFAKQHYIRHFHDLGNIRQKSNYYRFLNSFKLFTMQKEKNKE